MSLDILKVCLGMAELWQIYGKFTRMGHALKWLFRALLLNPVAPITT